MEEKMTEVQGEVQHEIGAVCNELQRLGSLEKDVGTLLEKMEILDRVDRALQNMGESKHPSLSQGKLASRDTPDSSFNFTCFRSKWYQQFGGRRKSCSEFEGLSQDSRRRPKAGFSEGGHHRKNVSGQKGG